MFIVMADIKLKPELIEDFKNWFSESNKTISKFPGFIARLLLEEKTGEHRILVEFETQEDFENMHKSDEHLKLQKEAHKHMLTIPSPKFFKIVAK